jgi:hypothetical protein
LEVFFWFDAGTNFNLRSANLGQQSGTFDIAHVSLVEGDATAEDDPFAARSMHQEYALCRRYFERQYVNTGAGNFGVGYIRSNTTARFQMKYDPKRTVPSFSYSTPVGNFYVFVTSSTQVTALDISGASDENALISASVAGLTIGQGCTLIAGTGQVCYIDIDAEL